MSQGRGNIERETKREKMDFCLRETPRFEFKSTRICEALFDVAKCQRKRCRIERDSQGEQGGKGKEEEKKVSEERAKCCCIQDK